MTGSFRALVCGYGLDNGRSCVMCVMYAWARFAPGAAVQTHGTVMNDGIALLMNFPAEWNNDAHVISLLHD